MPGIEGPLRIAPMLPEHADQVLAIYQAGQALAGQHVVQLALQRDPQAELVISVDGHGNLSFLRRPVAAAADRALCSPRT